MGCISGHLRTRAAANGKNIEDRISPLVGNAFAGDNFGECNADQKLFCYGVPLSVGLGLLGSHVSPPDARGPSKSSAGESSLATAAPSIKTSAKGGRSLSMRHHAGITQDVLSFNGVFSGHEH